MFVFGFNTTLLLPIQSIFGICANIHAQNAHASALTVLWMELSEMSLVLPGSGPVILVNKAQFVLSYSLPNCFAATNKIPENQSRASSRFTHILFPE